MAGLMAPVASAEEAPLEAQFWVHHSNAGSCCTVWFNGMENDPAHNLDGVSNLMLPSNSAWPGKPDPAIPTWPSLEDDYISYPMSPAFDAELLLDDRLPVRFDVTIGAKEAAALVGVPGPPVAGSGEMTVILQQGSTVIAETNSVKVDFVAEFKNFQLTAPLKVDSLNAADGNLVLRYKWVGVAPVLTIGGGPSIGHSNFVLPLAEPAPAWVIHQEELSSASVQHSFGNATSDVYVLNFTSELADGTAAFEVDGTGSVNATLTDAAGNSIFDGLLSTIDHAFSDATAGAWQLRLDYNNFTGTLSFALQAPATTGTATGTGTGSGTQTNSGTDQPDPTGNETVDDTGGNKESPMVAMPLLVLGLAAAMFVRRRL